jgi:putative aldouronate transport system permease protein
MTAVTIKKKSRSRVFTKKNMQYYCILIPAAIWFLIFCYVPIYGYIMSVKEYNPVQGFFSSQFANPWYKYFQQFFSYYDFWKIIKNTLLISFLKVVVAFPLPIFLAILINELRMPKFKKVIQTVSYLPNFVSWVVVVLLLQQLLSLDGVVNQVRDSLHLEKIFFMNESSSFYPLMFASFNWKTIGYSSIIFLATISNIDMTLYEAADIDGANRLQRIIYITLPSLTYIATFLFILGLGSILSAGWEQLYLLKQPGNAQLAEVLDTYVISVGLDKGNFSLATAVGLFQTVIALIIITITNYASKRLNGISVF